MTVPAHIFDLDKAALEELLRSWSMPRYRAGQVLRWVYGRGIADPHRMTDLPTADREVLAERLAFTTLRVAGHQTATDGTRKLLLEVGSGESERGSEGGIVPLPRCDLQLPTCPTTECVMIPSTNPSGMIRRTACVSSQVGCPVGCRFCASGLGGLERNLTAGQIVEQVWHLNRICDLQSPIRDPRRRPEAPSGSETDNQQPKVREAKPKVREAKSGITHIVFMGMGEPLTNFEHVARAVHILTAPWGCGVSARRITVSTVGLPAQIRRLAGIELPLTLALSLHAPNDELRRELIPWARYTSIDALIEACRHYFERTGREVTIEYILLGGVNDRPRHASQLARLARRMRCHVNLIRYNEVRGLPFDRPATEDVRRFRRVLSEAGVNVHLRASRGRDIAAACGQLRHEQRIAASA